MPDTRILLIAPSMNILGGQAVQARHLLKVFSNEPGIRMDFLPIDAQLPKFLANLPFVRTILRYIIYWLTLPLRIPRYDLIHIFSAGMTSYFLWTIPALLVCKLFRKKFILNYHDGQARLHLDTWKLCEPTLRMAPIIVSPSDFVVDVFAEANIPASRVYNIIDMSPFHYRQRRKLRPVFMTNRILEPLYNVDCILRAFAIIQKRYPEASLTIAHDGCSRPGLEALAKELGLQNTQFIGRVPHPKVAELYDSADIYLTSPNFDCMPGSLLECYASGLPLIATNTGGIPYIVRNEETGLLFEINDHEAMAEAAFRLLEDPDLVERLTRNAYKELDKYSWENARRGWLAVYHQLMTGEPGSPSDRENPVAGVTVQGR